MDNARAVALDVAATVSKVTGVIGGVLAAARTAARPAPGNALAVLGGAGDRVSSFLLDLPVGEPSPVVRLHHVSHAMRTHKESGQVVGADTLVRIGGFAPPTLHALGTRAASGFSRRLFNVLLSNVPGSQFPLYADGAKLLEMFPVVPLARNQALSIGLTSYDGGVYFGLNADRDAMSGIDVLAGLLTGSLEELLGTVRSE